MAKLEVQLSGDFDEILDKMTKHIVSNSMSSQLEGASDLAIGEYRCAVRVFERYSMFRSNCVSRNITLFQANNQLHLGAITAGGS